MRTISRVHTPEKRRAQRQAAQERAWRSLWRAAACASILRTAVTRLLPLCGAAAWWMAAACLVPGLLCYGLCCLAMRWTRTSTLPECARALLGRAGEAALCLMCSLAAAADGAASMTALVTLFTQGIGARGTQLTMAVLTGLLLLLSVAAGPMLQTLAGAMLYRAAAALLEPVADSRVSACMQEFSEVLMLLMVVQLSVGAMFLLLVAQLLVVGNLTVMLR